MKVEGGFRTLAYIISMYIIAKYDFWKSQSCDVVCNWKVVWDHRSADACAVIQGHDICSINPITCGHIQKHLQNVIKIVEIWSTLLFQNNISYQSDFNDFQWSEMWLFTKTYTKCHNSCYSAILSFPPKIISHASALLWSQTTFQLQTTSQDWLFQKSYFAIIYIDII
jgi:hypothetical protein